MTNRNVEGRELRRDLITLFGLIVGLAGVLSGVLLSWKAANTNEDIAERTLESNSELARFEVTFMDKREAYEKLLVATNKAYLAAIASDLTGTLEWEGSVQSAFLSIEPYLDDGSRDRIYTQILTFGSDMLDVAAKPSLTESDRQAALETYVDLRLNLRNVLLQLLFDSGANDDG